MKTLHARVRRAYLLSALSGNTTAGAAFASLVAAGVFVPGFLAMVAHYGRGPLTTTGSLALGALLLLTQAALFGSLIVARMIRADRTGTINY